MLYQNIKKTLAKIRHTPFHPQWFAYRNEYQYNNQISTQVTGTVLDIGCADQYIKAYVKNHNYIGLDYYQTAKNWYGTQPNIYGDAQTLPFANNSMDTILLLDVLEHLPHPENCINEIYRVLKPTGILILQVPFIYPIHDAPLDFHRWTQYGLKQLVHKYGFTIRQKTSIGKPLETAGLLLNIAISKTILNWLHQKNPAIILAILAPIVILTINLSCWLLNFISPMDEIMPHSYRLVLEK
ncbi:MAG: class I SAM-dependent methyltransferase [Proteobacteria bacterium]|nr:class I SAM-dependent methyltransferase [Pseudomonadota bacterium]